MSTNEPQEAAVYHYTQLTCHHFKDTEVAILVKEERCLRGDVKEAIYERIESPYLNERRGLCFSVSRSWDQVLQEEAHYLSYDCSQGQSAEAQRF